MVAKQDRVQVWAGQLKANDFPPVCAMTGAPAEVWRKFRFATAPAWAYFSLLLLCTGIGLLPIFIIMAVVSRRASGYLPLTKAARLRLNLFVWGMASLLPLFILLESVGILIGPSSGDSIISAISTFFIGAGLVVLLAFIVGVVLRRYVGPWAKVSAPPPGYATYLVELRHVNPGFVAAVNQMHQAQAAQYASIQPTAKIPLPPGSS